MLKICPFCGSKAEIKFAHNSDALFINRDGKTDKVPTLHIIKCMECGAKTQAYEDVHMAIKAWNRRANNDI